MGNCQCNAFKNLQTQKNNQVIDQNQKKTYEQNNRDKDNGQKRRGKNALLVSGENSSQMQDNVEYDSSISIQEGDIVEIKKALNKHFIFSQLNQKEIDCFIKQMKPCIAIKDNYIFKQGDKSGSYFIILEGVCERTLTYGGSFGDLGIIYNAPRSASVLAKTDCSLVQINRKIFKKVMDDINQLNQKQNKKFLSVLSFFKDLTQEQKNAIASTCNTQTYEEGQIIFNQGDDGNSFYVIQQGVVIIKEKSIELKAMDCFGQNEILQEAAIRTNTMIAKTKCKLISMSRQNIKTSLGDNIKNILQKNVVWNIIHQSKLIQVYQVQKLKQAVQSAQFVNFKKGETVFKKTDNLGGMIFVCLRSILRANKNHNEPMKSSKSINVAANSIIGLKQLLLKKTPKLTDEMMAQQQGTIVKIMFEIQPQVKQGSNKKIKEGQQNIKQQKCLLQKKMQINDFIIVRRLRQGNFGKVYACWNTKTQKMYAIKVLDRGYVQKSQIIQYIMNEQQILRTVPKHPFIVNFYKLIKDSHFIYFVMQFVQGEDLFDVITKVITFTPQHTRFLVAQILLMIQHMHNNRMIYRDLKPQNLMMGSSGYLTLVDMGTAKKLKIQRRFRTNTIIGTPHYMAPQIITGKGYSFQVDLWSIGVIAYQLFCGKLPFGQSSDDPFTIYEQIINSSVKYPRNCSKGIKSYIQKMLSKNPQHRIGAGYQQLKKHVFFEDFDWKALYKKQLPTYYKPPEQTVIKHAQIQKAIMKEKNKAPGRFLIDRVPR